MVYVSLANSKSLTHERDSANYYYQGALARATRLTEWERLRLQESWASSRGDRDSAIRVAGTIAERFPNAVTHYNYGTALMQGNRCAEARAPFERTLELDSASFIAHINLATCTRRAGMLRESIRHYEQAAAINPTSVVRGNPAYEFAGLLVDMGMTDSARRQFERIRSQTGLFDRTLGHRGLAFLALTLGRDLEAAEQFEATVEIGRQQRAHLSLTRGYMFTALAYWLGEHQASAGTAFEGMLQIIRTQPLVPQMLALAGWALCRVGRTADAAVVLDRLRQQSNGSQDDRGAEAFLVGAIALARGDAARADSVLGAGPTFVQPHLANLLRADALDRMGRRDSAASVRSAVAGAVIFGSESHFEEILQQRAASARTPTDRR
jgi:Tfp pilus assembly protein PilF